jgi:hypothetical protein
MNKRDDVALALTALGALGVSVFLSVQFRGTHWRERPWWEGVLRGAAASALANCLTRYGDQRRYRK